MGATPLDDLRGVIAAGQAVMVIGAGVSIAATGNAPAASWMGLLEDGVAYCQSLLGPSLPAGWAERRRAQLASGDTEELISAAEDITRRLGGPGGGEYLRWLEQSVGQLTATHPDVLEALVGLGVPLATTNYDGLLEQATGLPPVTWRDGVRVQQVLRGQRKAVLHLHGHWEDPASVVLGIRSYEAVLGDAHAEAMRKALAATQTLVFVGSGAGLADPNFTELRRWLSEVFASSPYRHYRLGLEAELAEPWGERGLEERIVPLAYGTRHEELAPFLRQLKTKVDRNIVLDPLPPGPDGFRRTFGGFIGDLAQGTDRLDIEQDVESLSTLLAARAIEPPISVGLFGDWGTGKSFFMDQMQRRIRVYASEAEAAEDAYQAGKRVRPPDFHSRIKQITFNAWHYADANLWAGLVVRIFEGLAEPDTEEQIEERDRRRLEQERVEILQRLESASELQAEAQARMRTAQAERSRAQKELRGLRRQQANARRRLATLTREGVRVDLGDLLGPAANEVSEATGEQVGATVDQLEELSGRLRFLGTRLALAGRQSWRSPTQRRLLRAGIGAAVVLAVVGVWLLATDRISGVVALLAPILASAVGIVPNLLEALSRINQASVRAERAVRDAELRQQEEAQRQSEELARREANLRARLEQLMVEETRVSEAARKAASAVDEAKQDLVDIRAGRRLYRFIEERAASSDYQRYVGLIGLIRRDFQELARLMKRAQGEREAGQQLTDPDLPRIDRIILYIDDLDRCSANRVVEVLQAVHLLLAFPLFAVVVGVDSRWLLRSLQRHYAAQLSSLSDQDAGSMQDGRAGGMTTPQELAHWAATPQSYLEKIFQIPFTIRRMDDAGFGRLLDDLFAGSVADKVTVPMAAPAHDEPSAPKAEEMGAEGPATPPAAPDVEEAPSTLPDDREHQAAGPAQEPKVATRETEPPQEKPEPPTIDLNPEGLRIEREEFEFIKRLSPMIGTPRAAKRLVNTYRLIRTVLGPENLDRLLGRHGGPAEHPVALVLLGILIGYPALAHEFFETLLQTDPPTTWNGFLATLPFAEQQHAIQGTQGEPENGSEAAAPRPRPSPTTASAVQAASEPNLAPDTASLLDSHGPRQRDVAATTWDDLEVMPANVLAWQQLERALVPIGRHLPNDIDAYRRWALVVTRYSFQTVRLVARGEGALAET